MSAVKNRPDAITASTDWATAREAFSYRFAPYSRAIKARKPMPSAESVLPTIQLMVTVAPTVAVAAAPRRPTMAESTYCAATASICSSIVGHARASTIPSVRHLSVVFCKPNTTFQYCMNYSTRPLPAPAMPC